MLKPGDRKNFATLMRAAKHGDLALLETTNAQTGEYVATIVAVSFVNGEYEFTPLAKLFSGNPYDELNQPNPDDGRTRNEDATIDRPDRFEQD